MCGVIFVCRCFGEDPLDRMRGEADQGLLACVRLPSAQSEDRTSLPSRRASRMISTWHIYDVAVLVTTPRFTRPARQTAERTGIRLVDNATLAQWNAGTIPAPWT